MLGDGRGLSDVAVSPDGSRLYVVSSVYAYDFDTETYVYSGFLDLINTATNTVVATVVVGAGPLGIAVSPDGSCVYVANVGGDSVSVINTATNTVVATVPVSWNPVGVAVSPDSSRVYVTTNGNRSVAVIAAAPSVAEPSAPTAVNVTPGDG